MHSLRNSNKIINGAERLEEQGSKRSNPKKMMQSWSYVWY